MFHKVCNFNTKPTHPKTLNHCLLPLLLRVYCHNGSSSVPPTKPWTDVAIFWDLDNKPPNSFPPYDAAVKLKTAASRFGVVRSMVAYANHHAFSYVPQVVREERKERKLLDQLERKGAVRPVEPYVCGVCGRRFYENQKLVNHFRQIHEREHQKRVNRIESATGKRRLNLVARFAVKIQKYKNAVRGVLTPKVGYSLADELKRAGFFVRTVKDRPQAADVALRDHMMDVMDKRSAECVVLVSDDSDFVGILREAKLRCLKTVVVGDVSDGELKRVADAAFSWQDILIGKAKKESEKVVGRWKDRDTLKKLEWTFTSEDEKKWRPIVDEFYRNCEREDGVAIVESEDSDGSCILDEGDDNDCSTKEDEGHWWELDSDSDIKS